jgi:hypothetical protein
MRQHGGERLELEIVATVVGDEVDRRGHRRHRRHR